MPSSGKKVSIGKELASAHRSLRALEQSLGPLASHVRDISPDNSAKPAWEAPAQAQADTAHLKALRLHGRYLGYIRQLKPRQRAEVKAVAKGPEGAVAAKCGELLG